MPRSPDPDLDEIEETLNETIPAWLANEFLVRFNAQSMSTVDYAARCIGMLIENVCAEAAAPIPEIRKSREQNRCAGKNFEVVESMLHDM